MAQEASTGHWKGQYPWPFGRDPNSSVLRRDVESDRLIGNVSVTYVTLVPWRRERRRHVPSPRLLYHRWAAGSRLGSSAKTWICAAPAAYLCSRCDQRQLDAIIACQCALARLVYTRSGLVSLSDIPIRRSSDVTSPFPPSGNEGYIRNRDVTFPNIHFAINCNNPVRFLFAQGVWQQPDIWSPHHPVCLNHMKKQNKLRLTKSRRTVENKVKKPSCKATWETMNKCTEGKSCFKHEGCLHQMLI